MVCQHPEEDGVHTGGVGSLIGVEDRQCASFDPGNSLKAGGTVSASEMFPDMMHAGFDFSDVTEHFRGGDDAGNRDALVAIDIAVHAGQIDERGGEAADEQQQDQSEGDGEFLADGKTRDEAGRCR